MNIICELRERERERDVCGSQVEKGEDAGFRLGNGSLEGVTTLRVKKNRVWVAD